jgi:hypothetical protein
MAWSVRLGFLGQPPFCFKDPRLCGLDFLGFPWILSSESRLINKLHEIFSGKFFSSFCLTFEAPAGASAVVVIQKARITHRVSLI